MLDNKKRSTLITIVLGLVIFCLLPWWFRDGISGESYWPTIEFLAVISTIVVIFVFICSCLLPGFRKDVGPEGERQKKLIVSAAGWTFFIGLFWNLFLLNFINFVELASDQAVVLTIAGQLVFFSLAYCCLARKVKI